MTRPFNIATDVTLKCPSCHAYKTVPRSSELPEEVRLIEIICPDCDDGDFHSERWFSAPGVEVSQDKQEREIKAAPVTEHVLKCLSPYWDAIARGDKNFEVRKDDRGFQRGDVLVLLKFDGKFYVVEGYSLAAKNCELRRRITYILTGGQFGIEPGYVVLGLALDNQPGDGR